MRMYLWSYPVDALTLEEATDPLISGLCAGRYCRVITLNPEMIMTAEECPALKEAIHTADLITPDGAGIVWALRRQGRAVSRLPGIDLAYCLMERLSEIGGSVYLLGGQAGVAEEAAVLIGQVMPGLRILGAHDGYFPEEEDVVVVEEIARLHPDLLLVGMGAPNQEIWLARYWERLNLPIGLGIGGALDIWAGRVRRAPRFLRDMNLEWLYRGLTQRGRWRRLSKLPIFVWRVFRG